MSRFIALTCIVVGLVVAIFVADKLLTKKDDAITEVDTKLKASTAMKDSASASIVGEDSTESESHANDDDILALSGDLVENQLGVISQAQSPDPEYLGRIRYFVPKCALIPAVLTSWSQ